MRIYWSYEEQSSHEGYIDMVFKEIGYNPKTWYLAYDSDELFSLIADGYVYAGNKLKVPSFLGKVYDFEGDYVKARVSKRLIKRWCERAIGEDREQLAKEWAAIEGELQLLA